MSLTASKPHSNTDSLSGVIRQSFSIAGLIGLGCGVSMFAATGLPGTLRVSELIAAVFFPVAVKWQFELPKPVLNVLLRVQIALLVWLGWQTFLDLAVHELPISRCRDGAAAIFLCLVNVTSMVVFLLRYRGSRLSILLGMTLGAYFLLGQLIVGEHILKDEYWDLRIASWGGPLILMVVLILAKQSWYLAIVTAFGYSCLASFYGARSHGLAIMIGAALPVVTRYFPVWARRRVTASPFKFAMLGLAVLSVAGVGYIQAARAGYVTSKSQRELAKLDNPYNPVELIQSARGGVFLGLSALSHRPLIGYGSKAFSKHYSTTGYRPTGYNFIHSIMFEAMAYGGAVGGFVWVYIAIQTLKIYPAIGGNLVARTDWGYEIFGSIAMITSLWVIAFSPLASARLAWFPMFAFQLVAFAITRYGNVDFRFERAPKK